MSKTKRTNQGVGWRWVRFSIRTVINESRPYSPWLYRKLALGLLTGTALVNVHIAYKQNKPSITEFREKVIDGLCQTETAQVTTQKVQNQKHKLEDVGRSKRRRCVDSYKRNSEQSE
jgi:hypothetical protein